MTPPAQPIPADRWLEEAQNRLNPSLKDPSFLVLRARRVILQKWIDGLERRDLRILDVGGRIQPYRPLFNGRIKQYVALDIQQTKYVDVLGRAEAMPLSWNQFDIVIATQAFEYFAQPLVAAQQIRAVLKPGGVLFMSAVGFAPRFGNEEKWRFTPAGIRTILAGFRNVEVVSETSSLGGIIRTLNLALHRYAHFHIARQVYEWTLCPLLNLLGLTLEYLVLTQSDEFAPNFSVRAEK